MKKATITISYDEEKLSALNIVDAGYDMNAAKKFIRAYLGDDCTDKKIFHFLV